jgi:hypothetical protein
MGQVRNGSVTTTDAFRGEIQRSQTSLAQLSKEMGINAKTVAKWRMRVTVEDLKTGSKDPRSIVLTEAEEVMIVVFGRYTLDIRLYDLQSSIMHLTRLELHRCLQRHGISLLLDFEGDKLKRQKFNRYPIGYSYRHRRGSNCVGRALSLCWQRPDQQVCSHATRGQWGSQGRPR